MGASGARPELQRREAAKPLDDFIKSVRIARRRMVGSSVRYRNVDIIEYIMANDSSP